MGIVESTGLVVPEVFVVGAIDGLSVNVIPRTLGADGWATGAISGIVGLCVVILLLLLDDFPFPPLPPFPLPRLLLLVVVHDESDDDPLPLFDDDVLASSHPKNTNSLSPLAVGRLGKSIIKSSSPFISQCSLVREKTMFPAAEHFHARLTKVIPISRQKYR